MLLQTGFGYGNSGKTQWRERHWEALLDSAGEGIWGVDLSGNCTFVNRLATHMFGFPSEEMVGCNMHALTHHHYADGREYPDADCPVYGVFRNNKPFRQLTESLFRKDGSFFLAEISAHPVTVDERVVGVVVTFRDVSDQRQQQEELRRAHALAEQRTAELDAVIESIPHGVFVRTASGQTRLNRRAVEMTGESFPPQFHTLERALDGEATTQTVRRANAWIRSVAAPILMKGQIVGGVAVNTDITQDRLQEETLRKSEKLAALGQLASSIAHEINNPLESLTNLLYLIRQGSTLEEINQYADMAQKELSRVSEITLQTLRFHRQQTSPAPIDISDLMNSILSLYAGRFLVRGVEVVRKLNPAPAAICLEGEIRQVLNNLIRNAIDAMKHGGRLHVRVRPACDRSGRTGIRVTIADTGEGIRPQIMTHLFEPFHTTKDLTGTGLGLWVSKGILDKHNGTIAVKTRRGTNHGTVFAVWLPMDNSALQEAIENAAGVQ